MWKYFYFGFTGATAVSYIVPFKMEARGIGPVSTDTGEDRNKSNFK